MKFQNRTRPLLLGAALAWACAGAWAQVEVQVAQAWARASVPGQTVSGAFMRITARQDVRLVGAKSPLAGSVALHEMSMDGGMMRMRERDTLSISASEGLELKPGGYHLMLQELRQPLVAGGTVPLTLVFEATDGERATVELQVPVRPLNAASTPTISGHLEHAMPAR